MASEVEGGCLLHEYEQCRDGAVIEETGWSVDCLRFYTFQFPGGDRVAWVGCGKLGWWVVDKVEVKPDVGRCGRAEGVGRRGVSAGVLLQVLLA